MESDDSNCTAKPDACNGRSSRCVYAWGNESELYVCRFAGNPDPVHPEYVSGGSNRESRDSGSAVLGKRRYQNAG